MSKIRKGFIIEVDNPKLGPFWWAGGLPGSMAYLTADRDRAVLLVRRRDANAIIQSALGANRWKAVKHEYPS